MQAQLGAIVETHCKAVGGLDAGCLTPCLSGACRTREGENISIEKNKSLKIQTKLK